MVQAGQPSKHAAPSVQVKAAGGVRDFAKMLEVRALGVSRVGASRTREMLEECRKVMGHPVLHTAPGTVAGY
jgi:deoxyribose-phosphate aldolase